MSGGEGALIVDVQRFSLHDGPGIRTTVFFKGCPLRCIWCHNPESLRMHPEIAFYHERCRSSRRCAAVCPEGAILDGPGSRIDFSRCTACGWCADACAHQALKLVGTRWNVEALLEELLKDEDFFADSGGGVTLSGGEPLIHAAFLRRLLPRLKAHRLHVTVQTCGVFQWAQVEPLLDDLDLIYFDMKHMDGETHRRLTGSDNRLLLENFTRLARTCVRLEVRIPVISGINDDGENIRNVADWLKRHGHSTLHCLPYHNLGEAKIARLAPGPMTLGMRSPDLSDLERVARRFRDEGIDVVLWD